MLHDVELGEALERLRKNFYHLWQVLGELRSSPSPDALLEQWGRAPKPSQEWRCALFYEAALDVLAVSLSLPREETEQLVRQYVFGRRQPVPSTSVEGAGQHST